MDKILEFINNQTDNKYPNLLFFGATYKKSSGDIVLEFQFEEKTQKTKQNMAEIEMLCKKYFDGNVKDIKVKFKSNSISMEDFKEFVYEKITSKILSVDAQNIRFDFDDKKTIVNVPYFDASNEEFLENEKIEIENEIFDEIGYEVELKFEKNIKNDASILTSRKDMILEDNLIYEKMTEAQIVDISNIEVIYGDFVQTKANLCNISGEGECTVVGNVKSFNLRQTNPKTEGDEKQPKRYLSVELEYEGESVKGMLFFPKDADEIEEIKIGTTIAISGRISQFDNEKYLRISSIAKCTFVPPKKVWRQCPKNYRYIKPEPYEFAEQTNFFSFEEKTKNKYLLENTFVVYDLETTGISPEHCKIIDIGAYKIVDGKIVEKFCSFVNPECEIPPEASKVNRITNQMVQNSPTIEMALPDFYKFCYGSIIVGYNNISFDDLFIAKESKKQFYNFDNKRDDVFNIAKKNIFGLRNYKLSTVCQFENVPLIDAHRASNDALATAKLFIKLVEKYC